jgi:TonB family protein
LQLRKAKVRVAFSHMRGIGFLILALTSSWRLASAEDLPEFRPALIGKAPDAIVNRIDEKTLLAAGQKNAAIEFFAIVDKDGTVKLSGTYRGTPDSKLLEQEVLRALQNAKMIPAVRNHEPVAVFFFGTVTFQVVGGKPRLRLFANQDANELKTENDFIAPQPCIGGDSKFSGLHYPETRSPVAVNGEVDLQVSVDAAGNLQNATITKESPPLLGFGDAALDDFNGAKFIPAFRNGQPVACETKLPLFYESGT